MGRTSTRFHVSSGDYFGTLATAIDLLRQALDKRGYMKKDRALLRNLTDELMYLQENYTILFKRRAQAESAPQSERPRPTSIWIKVKICGSRGDSGDPR